ncbi:MAG: sel1 repeat family protein, partial [Pseudomonas sp.]
MHKGVFHSGLFAALLGLSLTAIAQSGNPLLISTEERCSINRVDDQSLPLALEACEEAAAGGDIRAQFEMGEFYYQGERVEKDIELALDWFEMA